MTYFTGMNVMSMDFLSFTHILRLSGVYSNLSMDNNMRVMKWIAAIQP